MIRCKVQIDSKQERKILFHSKPEPLRVCKQIVNEFKIDLQNRYAALEEQQDDSNNSISLNDMNNNITEPLIALVKNGRAAPNQTVNSRKKQRISWRKEEISKHKQQLKKK